MTGNKPDVSHYKYCIIHGHFYQPPRENPWVNCIEGQSSAAPYHDWNERIYDECYRPNAYSRILDSRGMIRDIHNNYTHLSFNFGPTLFMWLEDNHPAVTRRILDADAESLRRLDNHGNALAQVYNHIIMPLASRRDQLTQIRWGKSFFRSRFGRETEGMWLAETAINMDTVTCLIEEGIQFVILSPAQAEAIRPLDGDENWISTDKQRIDTRHPCRIYPYRRDGTRGDGFLDVFFFNEQLSRAASFEDLLDNADILGEQIQSNFSPDSLIDQTVTIATDGETFGHHKSFGDMCLAYFFTHSAGNLGIKPVNFGWFLAKNKPRFEVTLKNAFDEGSAWSCAHGTGRWTRDCGCRTGGKNTWNQKWRTPLRKALRNLQKEIDSRFENTVKNFVHDPWALRDAYRPFSGGHSSDSLRKFIADHNPQASPEQKDLSLLKKLLEAQKHILYAFTSCGWFFADISGIETVQNLLYAARAIQLGLDGDFSSKPVKDFLALLDTAKSNREAQTGKSLFEHYALSHQNHLPVLCFTAAVYKTVFPMQKEPADYFGYTISLKPITQHPTEIGDRHIFCASVNHDQTGESGVFSIQISFNSSRLTGYLLPFDIIDTRDSGLRVLDNWKNHPQSIRLTLSDFFAESKTAFSKKIIAQLDRDSAVKYTAWAQEYETVLDTLSALSIKLPNYLLGPVSYLVTNQWDTAIRDLEAGKPEDDLFLQLRTIWKKAQKYSIPIDYSCTVPALQALFSEEMKAFCRTYSSECTERLRYLLNLVDRFSIPLSKNRLEDDFYQLFSTAIKKLYDDYLRAERPVSEQKSLLLQILSFARRMNFNTDTFELT